MRILIATQAEAGVFHLIEQDAVLGSSAVQHAPELSQPWGVFHDVGLVQPDRRPLPDAHGRVACWTGSPSPVPMARDVRTWGPEGMKALESACDAALERIGPAGGRLLLRPHARHVLSDVQRCLTFMLKRSEQPIGLLLDPTAMLDASMLAKASDHLRRSIETLAPMADAAWLANIAGTGTDEDDEDAPLAPAPLHQGLIAPPVVLELIRRYTPAQTPIIFGSRADIEPIDRIT
jgi:hypothetical protein